VKWVGLIISLAAIMPLSLWGGTISTICRKFGCSTGAHMGIGLAYYVQGAAAAINPILSWTAGTSDNDNTATIAVIQAIVNLQ
jgi:hypothetical protein